MSGPPGAGDDRLEVGRIGRAHGLRGEVAVTFTSNRPERSEPGARLHAGDEVLVIASARRHQGRVLVHFEGVDDRDAAEQLRGRVLTASRLEADTDGGDDLWVHEVIGRRVVDTSGHELGEVVAVEANPAHDLLVLGDGALVPVVFVVEQRPGEVVVDPPEGLFEL